MIGAVVLGLLAACAVNVWGHQHYCQAHPAGADCPAPAASVAKP
jgi:hypothetical protein